MSTGDVIKPSGNLLIGGPPIEPNITFHPGDATKEVMRIDRHGVKVNPEYTVDEATQHVLNALTAHIQHTVNYAVKKEREACAKVLVDMFFPEDSDYHYIPDARGALKEAHVAILTRGQQ